MSGRFQERRTWETLQEPTRWEAKRPRQTASEKFPVARRSKNLRIVMSYI